MKERQTPVDLTRKIAEHGQTQSLIESALAAAAKGHHVSRDDVEHLDVAVVTRCGQSTRTECPDLVVDAARAAHRMPLADTVRLGDEMTERAASLAEPFEQTTMQVVDFVSRLSDTQWLLSRALLFVVHERLAR